MRCRRSGGARCSELGKIGGDAGIADPDCGRRIVRARCRDRERTVAVFSQRLDQRSRHDAACRRHARHALIVQARLGDRERGCLLADADFDSPQRFGRRAADRDMAGLVIGDDIFRGLRAAGDRDLERTDFFALDRERMTPRAARYSPRCRYCRSGSWSPRCPRSLS